MQRLNAEFKGVRIENVATKVLTPFGEKARKIGEKIDKVTRKITIKID